jgi:hypothetical protein
MKGNLIEKSDITNTSDRGGDLFLGVSDYDTNASSCFESPYRYNYKRATKFTGGSLKEKDADRNHI